jgi:hypothetical protein
MLSGEKLVDNVDFRDQLLRLFPEACAGEMEGVGLYVACVERKTDWVVVKAICDWADGKKRENKDERQAIAAEQSIGFVLHAISEGGFSLANNRTASRNAIPPPAYVPPDSVHETTPKKWSLFSLDHTKGLAELRLYHDRSANAPGTFYLDGTLRVAKTDYEYEGRTIFIALRSVSLTIKYKGCQPTKGSLISERSSDANANPKPFGCEFIPNQGNDYLEAIYLPITTSLFLNALLAVISQ